MALDTPYQMYFIDVVNPDQWDLDQLKSLSTKVMEVVCKEHMIAFHKCLPMCDLTLGTDFLHQIQLHYDMNLELEMFTKNCKCWF